MITAEKEEFQQPFLRKTGLDAEGIVDTKNEIAAELKRRVRLSSYHSQVMLD